MCEYTVRYNFAHGALKKRFRISVPHIVENIDKKRCNIRVMYQERPQGILQRAQEISPGQTSERFSDVCYTLGSTYIDIHTYHFTKFFSFAKGINCCSRSAQMMVFSRLDPPVHPEDMPVANVNIYFASLHYEKEDYKKVRSQHSQNKFSTSQIKRKMNFYNALPCDSFSHLA